jgi:uncharacterized protein
LLVRPVLARTFPRPSGHVNDFANVISDDVEVFLETELRDFEASSSHELAVVTLGSLEGDVIENTAVELFEQWGIGKKDQDNGVLFLVVPNERSLRIEVGYGLEPILTDSRAGTIIRTVVTPEFKNNDYNTGIVNGTQAIIKVLTENPTAYDAPSGTATSADRIGAVMFIGFMMLIYLSSFWARSKRFWPGGLIGFVLGLIFAALTGGILLGLWGLLLDYLLSKNYKTRKKKGLPTSWWSSGGGFSSGRGFSSGGRSFGGFGGGRSGGGGASGSW